MKKWFFILTALFIFQKWNVIYVYFNPPSDYSSQHGGKVILYATDWCGYCAKTRDFLKEKKIAYVEYDIEKSSAGHDQYKSLGGNGVPLLLVNGTVVRGYNPSKILELTR